MKKSPVILMVAILIAFSTSKCGSASVPATEIAPTRSSTVTQIFPTPTPRLIMVSSAADAGPGTLRQALKDAAGPAVITFDPAVFPPDSPVTISLTSSLPVLSEGNLAIDASNSGVILDGSNITSSEPQNGISISSDYNIIRGLEIRGFTNAGIALYSKAQYNIIGGDRTVGAAPLGQGNLILGNGSFGIGLWDEGTSFNTIQGNYIGVNLEATDVWGHPRDGIHSNGANENFISGNIIGGNETGIYICCVTEGKNVLTNNIIGTDPTGTLPLGNTVGVTFDRSNHNIVGPGNLIAYNHRSGISLWGGTSGNTIAENSIHDNGELGIYFTESSFLSSTVPTILDFDLETGRVAGGACPYCIVELFSDTDDEGGTYEGRAVADESGVFQLDRGSALRGPHLTATSTDSDGHTSEFTIPTTGPRRLLELQAGNAERKVLIRTKPSSELADNRTGGSFHGSWLLANYSSALSTITNLGLKRADLAYGELEPPIDWTIPEYEIIPEFDRFIDDLLENDIKVNLGLHFWDKAGFARGEMLSTPRFTTEEQIQDYIEYVRFMVSHFRGRVAYYTVWSEPDNCNPPPLKCIQPQDYIDLARQTIPVIRQEDPEAKIVSAPVVLYFARDYLNTILRSDILPSFDVISWHPFYDMAPDVSFFGDYYLEYPSIVQDIKDTASGNGFKGEYWGTEISWSITGITPDNPEQPWEMHTAIQSAKYWARGIVMELGMDLGTGLGGPGPDAWIAYQTVRNVNTIMAGAQPNNLSAEVVTEVENLMSYGFTLPDGSFLFAIWSNGSAADDFEGIPTTIAFPELDTKRAIAFDVFNGFEQEMTTETVDDQLVIANLLIMDYPVIIHLIP